MGLYSLSSSVGWKVGDLPASDASLAFPFRVGSASIFRLRREFSCRSASISSALRFFRSANSYCILAWPSRMALSSIILRSLDIRGLLFRLVFWNGLIWLLLQLVDIVFVCALS